MPSLSDKIVAQAEALGPKKEKLSQLQKQLEQVTEQYSQDDADDSLLTQMEELSAQIEKLAPEVEEATSKLEMMRKAEQNLASRAKPVEKAPAFTHGYKEPEHKPGDFFVKSALATALAHINQTPVQVMVERIAGADERTKTVLGLMTTKAAVMAADTTTAGFAAELVRTDMRGFLDMLKVRSIGAALATRGMMMDFAGAASVTIPRMNDIATPQTEPAWVN